MVLTKKNPAKPFCVCCRAEHVGDGGDESATGDVRVDMHVVVATLPQHFQPAGVECAEPEDGAQRHRAVEDAPPIHD